ncbi:hypothetical protein FJZ17_03205 [Candidatus Pacearchaeota archaeon]|nr:hypothetical protein [Candidatus Pacearchaeota archaeon]
MNKKIELSLAFIIVLLLTLSFGSAEANYCCEKTVSGAWCQNAPQEQCDSSYQAAPTSCESTSYCKAGCCFDSREGLCMESTPQRVCEASNGTWADNKDCNIIQCQLGCCVLADQGAFVTLTRCKQISGFYGLKTDFRKTITDELTCIATASSSDRGACVTDNGVGGKTCKFTTRDNCKGSSLVLDNSTNASKSAPGFYKDVLCTAPELGTDCGKSTKTTLRDGKDEIYFTDTCGNVANIYDANRYDDPKYWRNVYKKSQSCGAGASNAGSKTCGNCDYYLGSIGKRATGVLGKPTYGDYVCVDLACKKQGKKHGESWCVTDKPIGEGLDTVGSRYYKEVCLNNEILTEPCADYRNEICIEGKFGSFTEAACRPNRWQDCLQQLEGDDCTNVDVRDCIWVPEYYYSTTTGQIEKSTNDTNSDGNLNDPSPKGICMPNYPPGFNFWGSSNAVVFSSSRSSTNATPSFGANAPSFGTGYVNPASSGTSATAMCAQGNADITIKWKKTEKPLVFWDDEEQDGEWECKQNCQYVLSRRLSGNEQPDKFINYQAWANEMNNICFKFGDCGGYINFLGEYTDEGYAAYYNNRRIAGSGGAEVIQSTANTSTTASATTPTFTNPSSSGTSTSSSGVSGFSGLAIKEWIKQLTS